MGRKRKAVRAIADEVKTSKPYQVTSSPNVKSRSSADNPSDVEGINVKSNLQPNSNGSQAKKKKSSDADMLVRRSGRARSLVYPARSRGVKPVVERVNVDENEKEEPPTSGKVKDNVPLVSEKDLEVETQVQVQVQVQPLSPRPDVDERSLEEKVNYLVRAVDEFRPKVIGISNEAVSSDFSYKSLYIQSQKKNEALMEENYELVRSLEFARGQIAAYEKMKDAMGALKEVIFVSGSGKPIEANVSSPTRTVNKGMPSPSAAVAGPDAEDYPKQKKRSYKNRFKN